MSDGGDESTESARDVVGWPRAALPPPRLPRPGSAPSVPPPSVVVAQLPDPSGLRTAVATLFATTSGLSLLSALASFGQAWALRQHYDEDASLDLVRRSDLIAGSAALLFFATLLAGAIVLSIWSHRTVSNARLRGVGGLKPGLAAGGWFIPIGWFWVPWNQLKAAIREAELAALRQWQMLFVGATVTGRFATSLGKVEPGDSHDAIVAAFRNEGLMSLVSTAILIAATIFARRAMIGIDRFTAQGIPPSVAS